RASASSPISTDRRVISKALPAVAKFVPVTLKIRHSTRMTASSTHSLLGNHRSRHPRSVPTRTCPNELTFSDMSLQPGERGVGHQRRQNDRPLNRLLPEGVDAEEGEGGADSTEQRGADQRPHQPPAPPGD